MSDQEPMVSDLDHDDLALYNYIKRTENNDIEYEGDSDSGSSIVYDLVQELKPPAANDSIFQNDTLVGCITSFPFIFFSSEFTGNGIFSSFL